MGQKLILSLLFTLPRVCSINFTDAVEVRFLFLELG